MLLVHLQRIMNAINKNVKYLIKKRKKSILTTLCFLTIIYAGIQFIYLSDDYSPLKLLSGVENEATRLVRFMGQPHIQCNNSLPTNNASTWLLCFQQEIGLVKWNNEEYHGGIVYSIGPSSDFSFEQTVGGNLSQQLYIFSAPAAHINQLSKISNTTSIFGINIVPNDPADFARNSFDSQTLNSVASSLKHSHIDILKLDSNADGIESHEILRFLIADDFLSTVKELHIVMKLDQVEADEIYSWYRALYALFHTAGFRLYHSSTSDPLCLQATIMESCRYFLSFIKKPSPRIFVLYPPAIDGSYHYEEDRMLDFLEQSSSLKTKLHQASFVSGQRKINVNLPKQIINTSSKCSIFFIVNSDCSQEVASPASHCSGSHTLSFNFSSDSNMPSMYYLRQQSPEKKAVKEEMTMEAFEQLLSQVPSNYMYIDTGVVWPLVSHLASMGIPKHLDILSFSDRVFPGLDARTPPATLRRKYSEMQRLVEFGLSLALVDTLKEKTLRVDSQDIYILDFVRPSAVP